MGSIGRIAKQVVDATIVPPIRYLAYRCRPAERPRSLLAELSARTAAECADYVLERMPRALQFARREELWDHVLDKPRIDGLLAEFGVWNGYSINYFARRIGGAVIHGFDSFEGLHVDWAGWNEGKGAFDRGGALPKVAANVRLVKGWFHETVPAFLVRESGPFAFVHIDCDTYEATKIILDEIGDRLRPGTIVLFDEYFGYRGWKLGEYKAWQERVAAAGIEYEYLAFSEIEVALRIQAIRG